MLEMLWVHDNYPIEVSLQLEDVHGPEYRSFHASEEGAQLVMELMRNHYNQTEGVMPHQIRWRDWREPNEKTGEPIWVMFPW